jgi:Transposase DDE domain
MLYCCIYVDMHIVRSKFKASTGKVYETVLLRESYREGKKVKKKTVANLTNCSPQEIAAIELALKHKGNLTELGSNENPTMTEGLSVGGVWVVYQMAKRLGIVAALGNTRQGQLALWQVIARVLEQGSRLSAVRLAETYAIASVIGLEKGFNEEDLYKNLFWLCQNQATIEDKIFTARTKNARPSLFLYDVTSSYLEGEKNELGDWGYNRDKKKGKKQVVVGLLSAEDGTPVTMEVFKGNTQDISTFASQIKKAKERFKCEKVTLVGDRGMIKSGQIEELQEHGFHYITAITKAQIETLIKAGVIQYNLFDKTVVEVEDNGVRYILKRNPVRVKEIENSRASKLASVENLISKQNAYLQEHPQAQLEVAVRKVRTKIERLALKSWLSVNVEGRILSICVNKDLLTEESKLDGCYVIKTDLPRKDVSKQDVHDRYKDLALVESAFRTVKSDLEIRPIYVRSEESTRGHVLVVMLSYMIIRELDKAWSDLYLTVEEGLRSLSTLTVLEVSLGEEKAFQQIPEPRRQNKQMLEAIDVELPKILPKNHAHVVTRRRRRNPVVKN